MTRPLLIIFLTIFVNLVGFGIIIPLLPFYAETFGAWLARHGQGAGAVIAPAQVQALETYLDNLSQAGSPALRQAIADERTKRGDGEVRH